MVESFISTIFILGKISKRRGMQFRAFRIMGGHGLVCSFFFAWHSSVRYSLWAQIQRLKLYFLLAFEKKCVLSLLCAVCVLRVHFDMFSIVIRVEEVLIFSRSGECFPLTGTKMSKWTESYAWIDVEFDGEYKYIFYIESPKLPVDVANVLTK